MFSQQRSVITSDDDDDDDCELPSLSERIKASLKSQNISQHTISDSESEDSDFLNFSERIRNTLYSQTKFSQIGSSNKKNVESEALKEVAEKNCTPRVNIKLDFSATSDSDNEESELLNFSQKIQSTPQAKITKYSLEEDSDSDERFSNFAQKLTEMHTPRFQNKRSYEETSESDSDDVFSNLVERISILATPRVKDKENHSVTVGSDVSRKECEFRTPLTQNRNNYCKAVDSESDESFSNFVEKLNTPMSLNRKTQHKRNESDSDDSFLNTVNKQKFKTPKSQKKRRTDSVLLPKVDEIRQCHSLSVAGSPNSLKVKSEKEKEFDALFQPDTINSIFLLKRKTYTEQLFEYFNRKVFNSQLPKDMPLIYDGALKTTAGLTCCSVKDGVYDCSIKLSSEILNSFDRLKSTLLHEMCHAAVWIINKQHKVHHGPLWQIWASRCKLILPFVECPTRCHNYEVAYRIWYHCPKCNWKKGRCRQVQKYHGAVCKKCKMPIIISYN